MSRKLWCVSNFDKNAAAELSENCGIDPMLALLLVSRGIVNEMDAEIFLSGEPDFFDPFLIADMEKAVERIQKAIDRFEKIAIFGDYDADGITSSAVLYRYLSKKGANVFCRLPDRLSEGYGISKEAVQELSESGTQLIITVDNGIGALDAIQTAAELNIDTVVTDHHIPGDILPKAVAVLNPHRIDCPSEFKDFAGVGVVFKLLCALEDGDFTDILEEYADLIALGTVADIVPLTGENRMLVQAGVRKINENPCVGLTALKAVCSYENREMTASNLGFTLAPRINASGRVASPNVALNLLLSEDASTAMDLAEELDALNKERQQIEADMLEEAIAQIEENPVIRYSSVLVVSKKGWHSGVIGIVAARLVTRYGKPAIVISEEDGVAHGSCRSIEGFSIYDALCGVSEHLLQFGGHPGAAGLTVETEKIDDLRRALDAYAKSVTLPFLSVHIDFKLNPASVSTALLDTLALLEPFGCQNPAPIFGLFRMTLCAVRPVGEGKHLRLTLTKGNTEITAMLFGTTLSDFPYQIGDCVDLATQIEKNEFRGVVSPSVHVKEIRYSDTDEENYLKSLRLYEKYRHKDALSEKEASFLLPNRKFLLGVFRFLQYNSPFSFDAETFCKRTGCAEAFAARVMISFDVLCELGLVERKENAYFLSPDAEHKKVDLSNSLILKSLEEKGA